MSFGAGTNSIVGGSQGGTMTDPIEKSPIAQPPNLNASGTPNANWNYANWAATNGYQGTPGNASGWATAQNTNSQTPNFYGNMSGYAPLPYQAFGAIPQITPQQIQPGDIGGFLPGYTSAVQQADQPMFQQQSDALNSDLASRGIYNSGAANASQGNLLAQQYATVLGQSLPYAQQDITGNVGAQNEALAANAAAYGNVTQGNQQNYNNYLAALYGGNQQNGQNLQNAYFNSYAPNQGLIGQGLGQAGQAYQNTYNQGVAGAGQLGGELAGLASSFFPAAGSAGAADAIGSATG